MQRDSCGYRMVQRKYWNVPPWCLRDKKNCGRMRKAFCPLGEEVKALWKDIKRFFATIAGRRWRK